MRNHTFKHIRQALDRIEIDLADSVTLDDIANAAHLSSYHFARLFRSATGQTVMDYLRRRRLALAAELLAESDENVFDIALTCGFGSHAAFSRAFKREFGLSPTAYRCQDDKPGLLKQRRILMPTQEDTLRSAEQVLRRRFDTARLTTGSVLSEHGWPSVIRAHVVGLRQHPTVIVRTFRSWAPYEPDQAGGPASGLFAEWAALEYLNSALPGERRIATLLAADRALGVVIMSDFGEGPTLDEVLIGQEAGSNQYVDQLADLLARIHAASLGQTSRFSSIRSRLGPTTNNDEALRRYLSDANTVLGNLDIRLSSGERSQVDRASRFALEPGRWDGIQHLEPGWDNLLVIDGLVRLVDFEGSSWGNVLRDVALPTMAWGHLPATYALTPAMITRFEARYFDTVGTLHPALPNTAANDLTMAKLALGLEMLGAFYGYCDSEHWAPWGGKRGRSSLLSQWQVLATIPDYSDLAGKVLHALERAWASWRPNPLPYVRTDEGEAGDERISPAP